MKYFYNKRMDTNKIMDAYETQMNFVRERNKMKYENKINKTI